MKDYLIEFLRQQLKEQQQISQNLIEFLAGLTGEPPANFNNVCNNEPATKPVFSTPMVCVATHGIFKLYSHADPGGDKKASQQMMSGTRTSKKESDDMKHLTKRSDGRWQGSKVIDGKRIFVYGRTQLECYEKLKNLNKKRKKSPKITSVAEFAVYFLETYKKGNVGDRTYSDYMSTVKRHLSIKTPLNKVTTMQLQDILNKLPATRIKGEVYQLMRQIFKKAYELDIIKKDVSAFLERGKVAKAERRALTVDEQSALVSALGDDIFARRVMFYLCTGARPSELATVRKDELRPGWVKINGTKTAKAVRWVKISERMYDILKNASSDFFKFDLKKFRQRLQRKCAEVGIKYDVDIYTLRHTFATNLYIIGVPEKDRQTYMGHTSGSAMTNDVYTTFSPDIKAQNIYDIYGDFLPEF